MHSQKRVIWSISLAVSWLAFLSIQAQEGRFTDVTDSLGLSYSYGVGLEYQYGLTSFNCGISLCDWNGDGIDDVAYGSPSGQPLYLFTNQGDSFSPASLSGLSAEVGLSSCLIWVDYDNDGDKDLFLTNISPGINKLYRNDGAENFTDVTLGSGVWNGMPMHVYSVSWGDYNLDGWLDCYLVNRDLDALNLGTPNGSYNLLYKNNGDGTFEDVTEEAGVVDSSGLGYAVVFFDYNNDGWPDLYVGNDKDTCNKLYKNNGDGTFEDVSDPNTTGRCISAMGIDIGDYDHNGYLDLYVTNGPGGNLFLHNNGDGTFQELADSLGIPVGHNGWGTSFEDFDNDGYEDLFAVNGGVSIPEWNRNKLFYNQGDNTFVEDTTDQITLFPYHSYGSTLGDWNDDGYPDIAVMNVGGDPMKFWQNNGGDNNWIKLHFQGTASNRDAIGTWVEVWTGGQKQIRYTMCGTSFSSQYSNNYTVGLGQSQGVDSIMVKWPSGVINTIYDLAVNHHYFIVEDTVNTTVDCATLYYPDKDQDGYGDALADGTMNCAAPAGMVSNNLDCNDNDNAMHPGASETCDGLDNDCNGAVDDSLPVFTYYLDHDNDGFGDPESPLDTCQEASLADYVDNALDCNDNDENSNPDGTEVPNNDIDEDCDGADLVVATHNLSGDQQVTIFPNPVRELLRIDYQSSNGLQLQLFDSEGQLVNNRNLNAGEQSVIIDCATWSSGTYWLIITDRLNNVRIVERVIRV